jgi:glycosyltransferase involved in cell wall biosynthesis
MTGISVIIPAYNRLDELKRAIDTVATADVASTEIIVIDDCSPNLDLSQISPRNAYGVEVRRYRLPRNGGPQAARNLGIRRAKFDYVAFLDSDEEYAPDKLDRIRALIARSNPDLVFHAEAGVPMYNRIGRFWARRLSSIMPLHWFIVFLNPIGTSSLVLRRQGRLGVPTFRHAEDWAFLLHTVRAQTRVAYIPEELSRVNRARGSLGGESAARWKMRQGEFAARRLLLRQRTASAGVKFALGTAIGCVRVAADVMRLRYWKR